MEKAQERSGAAGDGTPLALAARWLAVAERSGASDVGAAPDPVKNSG